MKKLKQLLKRRRKNSGFTLVEVVISCGLLGILVLGVTLFITPVLRSAASNEANVRANLLAETIDNYINRSMRSAYFVQIFTNADRSDAYDGGAIAENENLKAMREFIDKCVDSDGKKVFELKCISLSWETKRLQTQIRSSLKTNLYLFLRIVSTTDFSQYLPWNSLRERTPLPICRRHLNRKQAIQAISKKRNPCPQ